MEAFYFRAAALERAVDAALRFYGLEVDSAAGGRRPAPAWTFADQTRRIVLGGEVLALVRRSVPVGDDDRRLICRLVDGACARREEAGRRASTRTCERATAYGLAAYAAAGGGAVGRFTDFARRSPSSIPMLEPPPGEPASRQDVRPMPATTNPAPRKTPPGTAAPTKTDPARTIRSSRWSASRKEVKR